jgi:hypothetical protein
VVVGMRRGVFRSVVGRISWKSGMICCGLWCYELPRVCVVCVCYRSACNGAELRYEAILRAWLHLLLGVGGVSGELVLGSPVV